MLLQYQTIKCMLAKGDIFLRILQLHNRQFPNITKLCSRTWKTIFHTVVAVSALDLFLGATKRKAML